MQLVWQTDNGDNITKIGFVDFLILGMAEEALAEFIRQYHSEQFEKVPNLVWISKGKLISNQ